MPDRPSSDVMSALPRTRPHRRSEKRKGQPERRAPAEPRTAPTEPRTAPAEPRTAPAEPRTARAASKPRATPKPRDVSKARARKPTRLQQPAQPAGTPPRPRSRRPLPATGTEIVGTAVQAAAELAEIGLSMSARMLRNAVSRLPRP
jgi:hypothetical protein